MSLRKTAIEKGRPTVSFLAFYKKQYGVDEEFYFQLSRIPLEDIVCAKLELLSRGLAGKLYGIPLIRSVVAASCAGVARYLFCISGGDRGQMARISGHSVESVDELLEEYGAEAYCERILEHMEDS